MKLCRTELQQGVALNTVTTDRFKTAFFTVNLFVPLQKETASAYSLLTDVLMRGTESYPTMQALNQKQDTLYSLGLGAFVQKKGEAQVVTFELTAIDDSFAVDGMEILGEGMKLMQELIFRPYTEQGLFKAEYVEQEKKNLCDDIRGRINNKTAYARNRCVEIMCEGEAYAVDHGGDLEDVNALTPASLWEAYEGLLAKALPGWYESLKVGGAVAVSFNAQNIKLETVRSAMEEAGFEVMRGGAYDGFAHWVEQAVTRDIAVCRRMK